MKSKLNLKNIQLAASQLSNSTEDQRDLFLKCLAVALVKHQRDIIEANKKDVSDSKQFGLSSAFLERLILDGKTIKQLVLKLGNIEKLHSALGEVIEEKHDQRLTIKKVRVPIGVITVIYESRPEVTIDVAALCIKSGNAVILKGGSEALQTNQVLYSCILTSLKKAGFVREAVSFISSSDRKITDDLLKQNKYIDLVIARGGYDLVKSILEKSTIPALAHAAGGARIYIDESADLQVAEEVIINAKTSKPSACNSLDTVVLHQNLSTGFLSKLTSKLWSKGVKIIENDWDTEFLGLDLSIKIVKNVEEAVKFINFHSKKHSEGIIATDKKVIEHFTKSVDAASLFINCSTRLHDGYIFGLGSEMGIATGKFHARGPVGLKELTTYKWEVYGNGQIR